MENPDKRASRSAAYAAFLSGMNASDVRTEYEVLQLMRRCAAQFAFSDFLITRLPLGEQQRFSECLVLSSWPADRVRRYEMSDLFQDSVLSKRLRHTKLPIFADTQLLLGRSGAATTEKAAAILPELDMSGTFSVLLHTTTGEPFAVLLSGARAEPAHWEKAEIYLALVQVFELLEQVMEIGPPVRERLSAREVECLRWAAAGKSSEEIAVILGISAYTVSSYFKTATRKLDAVNRMQAIARAMRLKLI